MDEPSEEQMQEAYDETDLSDDEFEEQSFYNLLDRVESNGPSLTNLKVRLRTLVQNSDYHQHKLAVAIGRNTHLKALMLDCDRVQHIEAHAMILFCGIACNQSIKRFYFKYCGEYVGNACRILTPLFKSNQVERIHIHDCELSTDRGLLVTSLAEFDSLKEFALIDDRLQDEFDSQQVARDLVQSLSGHSGLRKLYLSDTKFGKFACSALVDLLSNPNTILKVIDLAFNRLHNTEAVALASVMAGNISLKKIDLGRNPDITEVGWQAIFDAMSSPNCRLAGITLSSNMINDAAAQSLSIALTSNTTTLKSLDLGSIYGNLTPTGWRVLFGSLRSPTCGLEDLFLCNNRLNDDEMNSLIDALANNRSLRSLDVAYNQGFTEAAWQRFFSVVLTNPSSGLAKLDLGQCNINDTAIRALIDALVNSSKLKVLDLSRNQVTNAGWEIFSSVLESPKTALEELSLAGNEIDDTTLTSLVNSLANNNKLKKLVFDHSADWEPPMSVHCNAASIMDTFNSNHTLEKVVSRDEEGYEEDDLPEEFESLLQINRENSPSQAARLKIINTHFNGGFITQPFVGMDLNVLPYAMAWMNRDGRFGEVNGHFYGFIRSVASLFERAGDKGNKRKRSK